MNTPGSRLRRSTLCTLVLLLGHSFSCFAAETVWLHELDLALVRQGWGKPQVNRSVTQRPITIAGKTYERGVGTHARSVLWIELAGATQELQATVGIDDAAGAKGSARFKVMADGKTLWDSGVMKHGQSGRELEVDLSGARTLLLLVEDAEDGIDQDHANWAEAKFSFNGPRPRSTHAPTEEAVILTPKPGPAPRINGPTVYGCRPGNPFIYRVPTTGERPIRFSARGLPAGLMLDAANGMIRGSAPVHGDYDVRLEARNRHGSTTRRFRILSGDTLALTPPMGWNHWYAHYDRITDAMMRQAADAMVASGMADVGYQYVSIDDCWMNAPRHSDALRMGPLRDAQDTIVPNKYFPDMKALTDYIHAYGLKAGIYTSPGPLTCGGFAGSYGREARDARTFADWGFDFLKYDWCSYGDVARGDASLAALQRPYRLIGALLREQKRDIVLNLCQYGMGKVWEWGAEVGGHCWRTAGDLGFELDRIFEVALKNAEHRAWSKPGAWNDPDYVQIGYIGAAHGMGQPRPCPLTPSEQYAFMSLWCLMASPLFFSGDMSQLDAFTLNVLCNPEVIDIDQDPLGQSARVVALNDETFLLLKDLVDGSHALGLCNRGEFPGSVTASWDALGLPGKRHVRDLWQHRNLGLFDDAFTAKVPRRGVVLVRLTTKPVR